MKKTLRELINIRMGDVISVVGSGGKSTLIYNLGRELKENKVLITTTTKMYYPKVSYEVDYFFSLDRDKKININLGRTFLGRGILKDNKVFGDLNLIESYRNYFDFVLIESDGSKRKPLKAWNEEEPVIFLESTKTIGVVPIHIIGEEITEEIVHRLEIFKDIFKVNLGDKISLELLCNIITCKEGLFKEAKGEKILFINRVSGRKERELVWKLREILSERNKNSFKIIGGDLKKQTYYDF